MKKLTTLWAVIILGFISIKTNSQVVIVTDDASYTTPASGAMLDVKSTSKGLLPPRVSLISTADVATIPSPAAGLIVYNTNASITNGNGIGYYYWDGTTWVHFEGSGQAQVLSTISLSANATLLKTNNIVFSSGNITLTLPVVTAADNGVQISVKNTGTFTDLVTVQGSGGATIDNLTTSSLTRWEGKTYVATGGNWIVKEKSPRIQNIYDVSPGGSWTTIAEAIAFLNTHMTAPSVIRLGGGTFNVASSITISLPYPLTIEGSSFGESTIAAQASIGGAPVFSCFSECYFKMISFDGIAATNDGIRFTGNSRYFEVKDCDFIGFTRAIALTGTSDLWVFETDFEGASTAGVEVAAGNDNFFKISESDFTTCVKGINLATAANETVSILNCTFYNSSAGEIGINYIPATFTTFSSMFITNNAWNNIGTFMNGFDFSLASGRDAKAFIMNNAGMEDKNPHCQLTVLNNSSVTTINNANQWYKASWTNTSSYTCKWTISGNKITYQPVNSRDVILNITGNLKTNQSTINVSVAIVKNGVSGTRYGQTSLRCQSSGQPYVFATTVYINDVNPTDYFELYVSAPTGGTQITVTDLNWVTNSQ
jgi:hypothetical protein